MANMTFQRPKAPFILLPLYIYPSQKGKTWAPLFDAVTTYPELSFVVIVNPDSGPGRSSTPDENYFAVVSNLARFQNVTILGYVAVSWAERDFDEVARDIRAYYYWMSLANTRQQLGDSDTVRIRIDGIFFDEAPSKATEDTVSYMANATALARSLAKSHCLPSNYERACHINTDYDNIPRQSLSLSSPCTIIYNPGTPPAHLSPFFDSSTQADYIVIFEQTLSTWPSLLSSPSNPLEIQRSSPLPSPTLDRPSSPSSPSAASSSSRTNNLSSDSDPAVAASERDHKTSTVEDIEQDPVDPGREYISSALASLSPSERAKCIAIAHSVSNLDEQLRFAADVVGGYGLAGHFATSTGDYSYWSKGFEESGVDLVRKEISAQVGNVTRNGGREKDTEMDGRTWMGYVEGAHKLAGRIC